MGAGDGAGQGVTMGGTILVARAAAFAGVGRLLLVRPPALADVRRAIAPAIGAARASVVLLGLFIWYERRVPQPIIDPRLFKNAIVAICAVVAALVSAGLFGATQYLPLFL